MIVRMGLEGGVKNPIDRLALAEKVEDSGSILQMALHSQCQGFNTLQQIECVGRRKAGAKIAQPLGARSHNERGGTELLGKHDAVIARIRRSECRELTGGRPVEPTAVNEDSADCHPMAADPFGNGIHDDVSAKLDRPAKKRGRKGIVDQKRNAGRVGNVRNLGNIEHLKSGITDGFRDQEPRARTDRLAEAGMVAWSDEAGGYTETRQCMGEKLIVPP